MIKGVELFIQFRMPFVKALLMVKIGSKILQPRSLFTFGLSDMRTETTEDLGLGQHLKHLGQYQGRLIIRPAALHQRPRSRANIADFCITELARPKMRAFAHDHAHPQRL